MAVRDGFRRLPSTLYSLCLVLVATQLAAQTPPSILPTPSAPPATHVAEPVLIEIDVVVWRVDLNRLRTIGSKSPLSDFLKRIGASPSSLKLEPGTFVHVADSPLKFVVHGEDVSSAFQEVSSPKLVTLSGQEASIAVGTEEPISLPPSPEGQSVDFRPVGLHLSIKPHWLSQQTFFLDVSVDSSHRVASENPYASLPAIAGNRVAARGNLRTGQSIVICFQGNLVQITPTRVDRRALASPGVAPSSLTPSVLSAPGLSAPALSAPGLTAPGLTAPGLTWKALAPPASAVPAASTLAPPSFVGPPLAQHASSNTLPENLSPNNASDPLSGVATHPGFDLTVDLNNVAILKSALNQPGILLVSRGRGQNRQVELVTRNVLARPHTRTVSSQVPVLATIAVTSQDQLQDIQKIRQESGNQTLAWFVLGLPRTKPDEQVANPRRLLEHEIMRNLAAESKDVNLIEVAPEQKTVRVPAGRRTIALLPDATSHNFHMNAEMHDFAYASILFQETKGRQRIGERTVLYVSEAAIELEALLQELEPSAKITVIEVGNSGVLLRGTVSSQGKIHEIENIAEQFFPRVLNQLRWADSQASQIEPASRLDPVGTESRLAPVPQSSVRNAAADGPQSPANLAQNPLSTRVVKSPSLPSLEEVRQLRDEIRDLRRDIQRLASQLQSTGATRTNGAELPPAASEERPRNEATRSELDREGAQFSVKAYHVADLILPTLTDEKGKRDRPEILLEPLQDLVLKTVQPNSWTKSGGKGGLTVSHQNLSLIVFQQATVHREIEQLFESLRSLQNQQIVYELALARIPRDLDLASSLNRAIGKVEMDQLRQVLESDKRCRLVQMPKCTSWNGQPFGLTLPDENCQIALRGVVSTGSEAVKLAVGVNGKSLDESLLRFNCELEKGASVLYDISPGLAPEVSLFRRIPGIGDIQEAAKAIPRLSNAIGQSDRVLLLLSPAKVVVEEIVQ